MDWRVAVLVLIGLVLVAGFAWYERTRPSSRVVAIVAALTALAVAGRLVFTPVPNVVATTDVALLTGFALGGPPGFVVGALAAPISNIWLGQGPWTPWQMAGWGLAGLVGAGMARVLGRECGRLTLAFACATMGFLYGALLDLSVMVSYGGEQSLDRYLAIAGRGIPFNLAHAAGNFAIALAAGPALVRMISRYRERLTFTWHPAGALPVLVAGLALLPGLAAPPEARADASGAASYLRSQQNPDGGFPASPGGSSSAAMTTWASLGLEGAGVNPRDVVRDGRSPIDFLRDARVTSATDLERTILVVEGAGLDSRSFGGRDLVAALRTKRKSDGSWEGQVNITAFGILALGAAGQDDVGKSAGWLRSVQNSAGGWGFAPGRASDADSTGAAMQALAAAGGSGSALDRGIRYLAQTQGRDGGWTLAGGVTNSQSTSWALQGLVSAGAQGSVVSGGVAYLAKRQASDGHYRYSSSADQTPIWVTAQGILGVKRRPFPLAAVARVPQADRPDRSSPGGSNAGSRSGSRGSGGTSATGPGSPAAGQRSRRGAKRRGGRGENASRRGRGRDGEPSVNAQDVLDSPFSDDEPSEDEAGGGVSGESEGMSTGAKVGAGLGGLTLALGAGFFVYRRRF